MFKKIFILLIISFSLYNCSTLNEINEKANKCFKKVVKFKPKSSKKESKEIYIYCKGF